MTMSKLALLLSCFSWACSAASQTDGWSFKAVPYEPTSTGVHASWKPVSPPPTPRDTLSLITLPDGSVLALGGTTSTQGHSTSAAAERYFPSNDSWITLPNPMPSPRENFGAALMNGKVYCIGGSSPNGPTSATSVDILDISTWTWSKGPELPTNRMGPRAVFVPDLKGIMVVGGFTEPFTNESYHKDTLWLTEDSTSWIVRNETLFYRRSNMGLTVAKTSGIVYAVGGGEVYAGYPSSASFDPVKQQWSNMGPLSVARSYEGLATAVVNGTEYLYAIAGMDQTFAPLSSVERWSDSTGKWEDATPFPQARGGISATSIMNHTKILVVGGLSAYLFSP